MDRKKQTCTQNRTETEIERKKKRYIERDRDREIRRDRSIQRRRVHQRQRRMERERRRRSNERDRQAGSPPAPQPRHSCPGRGRRPAPARGPHAPPLSYSRPGHLGCPVLGPRSQRLMRPAPASLQGPRQGDTSTLPTSANTRGSWQFKNRERKHLKHHNTSEPGWGEGPWSPD